MPYDALYKYYLDSSHIIRQRIATAWDDELTSPLENKELRNLLLSSDKELKNKARNLIGRTNARSLA
ncbi:MAG: hypothetical protein LBC74_06950, partial [Planctomycetaceae bacterium]|nr:hypothetical protein [Planctomycetaceae bacterium]